VGLLRALLAGLLLTGVLVLGGASAAHACTCAPVRPNEQLDEAALVFTGTVVDVDETAYWRNTTWYRFAVDQVFKGDSAREVELRTAASGSSCGFEFEDDRRYLVYASAHRGALTTGLCSNNLIDPAPTMLDRRFEAGQPPNHALALPPDRVFDPWDDIRPLSLGLRRPVVVGLVIAGALAIAFTWAMLAAGRRRRSALA
jgi:hypothetical protein